ncbi:alpha/beta hydrolase [Methylocella tundrae]|uniref:alpha/beta hydrolase n=1 Tax=Methylocella tundrae TaxID=227605 RepID=UPI001AED3505|nr:alpha/beta hydrolase [Methylocella tundrae]
MKQEVLHRLPNAPAGRPPVLFVHGAYSAAWIWEEHFLRFFADRGYPAYAVSLRGHGASEGDLSSASFSDYVDDVEIAAKAIGGEPVLIGHSMGGLVAQHYLARGGKAKALVALASAPPSGLRSSALHMTMFAPDVLFQLALLQSLGPNWTSPAVISRALFSSRSTLESKSGLFQKIQRESPRASADLLAPPALSLFDAGKKTPTFVLGGDADVFLPRSALQEIADFWQGDLEVLPGAPHGLMIDTAWRDITAEKIIAWLDAKVAA